MARGDWEQPVPGAAMCVVSTVSRLGVGGLPTLARQLCRLAVGSYAPVNVARFRFASHRAHDPVRHEPPEVLADELGEVRTIAPSPSRRPLLRVTRQLIHRPPLQGPAIRCFSFAYGGPMAAAVPAQAAAIHFVGSGWELLGFSALELARRRRIPFTVWPAIHPGTWGDSTLDGRLYQEAAAVFALSRDEAARLRAMGVAAEKITICPLGPSVSRDGDAERFRGRHDLGSRPLVLFIGRKERYKGFHALCEAMPAVLEHVPDAVFVAAGGPGEPAALPPADAYLDLGQCDDATAADAMAACSVFCMPSAGESFGIGYVDAWSYGKPVVVGPAAAPREMVADSGGGVGVEQDPREIAEALVALLTDRARADGMGERGREHQQRHYTWARMWEAHHGAWAGDAR